METIGMYGSNVWRWILLHLNVIIVVCNQCSIQRVQGRYKGFRAHLSVR